MKIDLTREDYLALLTSLQIADWILHAGGEDPEADTEDFRALQQKVLTLAEEAGCEALVEDDPVLEMRRFSREFELKSLGMAYVDRYEDEVFWDWLVRRLTERDLIRKLGEKAYMDLDPVELAKREGPYLAMYDNEIESHGLERLEIVENRRVN
ncbi:hypothetical protein KDK88_03035 [bacterium]|nr:hypothetical protein [bacterium]